MIWLSCLGFVIRGDFRFSIFLRTYFCLFEFFFGSEVLYVYFLVLIVIGFFWVAFWFCDIIFGIWVICMFICSFRMTGIGCEWFFVVVFRSGWFCMFWYCTIWGLVIRGCFWNGGIVGYIYWDDVGVVRFFGRGMILFWGIVCRCLLVLERVCWLGGEVW